MNFAFGVFASAAVADRPAAVRAAVDRLLASPAYGERWGRHWLDVARYADTNGSEVDQAMANAWRYRDYVVAAFNADKPFDRFVQEQVAGDLLPDGGTEGVVATGFLMLGPKALADLDKPKLLADVVDEQLDTVGRAFVGLTLGCARCHDHKFDPVSDEDYYALAGIFTSTHTIGAAKRVATWHERPIADARDRGEADELKAKLAALRAERATVASGGGRADAASRLVLEKGQPFLLIEAERFARGNVRVDADSLGRGIGVVRTRQEYPDHVEYEFDVAGAGDYQLELRYAAKEARPTELHLNGNLETIDAAGEVTGDWTPAAQRWFVQGTYSLKAGRNVLAFHRDGPVPLFDKLLIGRPQAQPHSKDVPAAPAAGAGRKQGDAAADKQRLQDLDAQINALETRAEQLPSALAPREGAVADAPVLVRGNPATPGSVVPRGFPRIVGDLGVPPPGKAQSGRLELAHWLAHPRNPLTARVAVNRVWTWHFGHGLVRSPDNFGLRGERPSHPELLDYLADRFVTDGWSVKAMHRLICTSATYQQASDAAGPPPPPTRTTGCSGGSPAAGSRPRRSATPCSPSPGRSTKRSAGR